MSGDFHEVLFPTTISYGSGGGPRFKNTVFTADSGHEQRDEDWLTIRAEYDVAESIKDNSQMDQLLQFFMCRRGRAYGFRYKDWSDFSLTGAQIGVGDWGSIQFQLAKTYTSAQAESGESFTYVRPITKPAWGTLAGVTLQGDVITENPGPSYPGVLVAPGDTRYDYQFYEIDYTTGLLTMRAVPYGPIYNGECTVTTGTVIGTPLNTNLGPFFISSGSAYTHAQYNNTGTQGIRKYDLATGNETQNQALSPEGQALSSFVCVAQDGSPIVQYGGGSNGQAMAKLDPTTFADTATWGAIESPFPTAGNTNSVGGLYFPGVVANDGNTFARSDLYVLNALISVHKTGKDGSPFGTHVLNFPTFNEFPGSTYALCPYDLSDILLLTGNQRTANSSNLTIFNTTKQILSIDVNDTATTTISPYFMCYDEADATVLLGWEINSLAYISKIDFQTATEVYRRPAFGIYPGMMQGAPVINGTLKWVFEHQTTPRSSTGTDTGIWIANMDTTTGDIIARPVPVTGIDVYGHNTYDVAGDRIVNSLSTSPLIIDTSTTSVSSVPGQPLVVGACEFHVPVRFDTDKMDYAQDFWETSTWPKVPLVEVKNWADVVNPPEAAVTFTFSAI